MISRVFHHAVLAPVIELSKSEVLNARFTQNKRFIWLGLGLLVSIVLIGSYLDSTLFSDTNSIYTARQWFVAGLSLVAIPALTSGYARLFYTGFCLLFLSSTVAFLLLIYDGSPATHLYGLAAFAVTFFIAQIVMQIPSVFSLPTTLISLIFFSYHTWTTGLVEWILHAGTLIFLVAVLGAVSILNDIDWLRRQAMQRKLQRANSRHRTWSTQTSRLLRHEIANQLIALKSSIEMHALQSASRDKKIDNLKTNVTSLQRLINEIALASDIEHETSLSQKHTDFADLCERVFSAYSISLKRDTKLDLKLDLNPAIANLAINLMAAELQRLYSKTGLWGEIKKISHEGSSIVTIALHQISREVTPHTFDENALRQSFPIVFAQDALATQGVSARFEVKHFDLSIEFEEISSLCTIKPSDNPAPEQSEDARTRDPLYATHPE